jgi:hypothetical protein
MKAPRATLRLASTLFIILVLLLGQAAVASTINFDELAVPAVSVFPSNQYVAVGVVFITDITVFNVCVGEPSFCDSFNTNGGSGSNALYLPSCVELRFVVPGFYLPAVIDSFSARFFDTQPGSLAGTIEAYDVYDHLIASVTSTTPDTNSVLLQVSAPGIARISLCTDEDAAYVDNLSFTAPAPRRLVGIRPSQMEICWASASNAAYRVEYRSELITNWTDLFPTNIVATDDETCVLDDVPRGQPQRYYRVVEVP